MRLRLILLLIVALFTAPLAPARAEWSCPDGTPCVAAGKQAFECAGGQCRVHSCCEKPSAHRCRHGALPEAAPPGSRGNRVETPDHCRFHASAHPQLLAVHDDSRVLLAAEAAPALLPARFRLPQGLRSSISWLIDAYGYRPPPLLRTGPSRAPPFT